MLTRRRLVYTGLAASGAFAVLGGWLALHTTRRFSEPFTGEPEDFWRRASRTARELANSALEDLGGRPVHDLHVHLAGLGTDSSGIYVNPRFSEGDGLIARARFYAYLRASGISDLARADRDYVNRVRRLATSFGGPVVLHMLALDYRLDERDRPDPERSEFHVPNAYAIATARQDPEHFRPVASIHPRRPDALARLERAAAAGVRMLKWIPNTQRIDPLDARHDPFYARMAELGVSLLSHTGIELAVEAREDQELGNPLRLRRPLDKGVRVIAAHCASLGDSRDLDNGGLSTPSFDLFLRMLGQSEYEGRLFGELSAICLFNRSRDVVQRLLARTDIHTRLLNGSDYPLSAIPMVLWPRQLSSYGHLDSSLISPLDEIHSYNPLLFEFVLKRNLRGPGGERFPPEVFTAERWLESV